MKRLKQLRSCAVRLERAVISENQRKNQEHVIRSCKVTLERIQIPKEHRLWKEMKSKDDEDDDRLNCIGDIQRSVDIMISTPRPGWREVYYTMEAKNSDSDHESVNSEACTSRFEEWRLETILALPADTPNESPSPLITEDSTKEGDQRKSCLVLNIPPELSYVFNVNNLKDDLPSILSVLSGNKMSSLVLDAYMTLLMQNFSKLSQQDSSSGEQPQKKRRKSSRIPHPSSQPPPPTKNFQYLSVFYFPIFSGDVDNKNVLCLSRGNKAYPYPRPIRRFEPKFKFEDDLILIAPQFALGHFYLAMYDFSARIIHVYDSCWKFIPSEVRLQQVQTVLKHLLQAKSPRRSRQQCHGIGRQQWEQWYVNELGKCVQQIDEFSCGCYVINFTENILCGKTTAKACSRKLNKIDIVNIRRNIVKELLPTTKVGCDILKAITEHK